jgi:hypothetical protein
MRTYIYSLSDKNGVRYIGQTSNIIKRYKEHLYESNLKRYKSNYLYNWINSVNKEITIELIDEVPTSDRDYWEQWYITLFKVWGFKLVNGTSGGFSFKITSDVAKKIGLSNCGKKRKITKSINKKYDIDRNELYNLFINKNLSKKDISEITNIPIRTIKSYLQKYNIFKLDKKISLNFKKEVSLSNKIPYDKNRIYSLNNSDIEYLYLVCNLTQKEVASIIGVHYNTISKYVNNLKLNKN